MFLCISKALNCDSNCQTRLGGKVKTVSENYFKLIIKSMVQVTARPRQRQGSGAGGTVLTDGVGRANVPDAPGINGHQGNDKTATIRRQAQ